MNTYRFGIIGGGLVGLTTALTLSQFNLPMVVIEANDFPQGSQPNETSATIALSLASIQFLDKLGIWEQIKPLAKPIKQVQVTVQGQLGSSTLNRKTEDYEVLGFVVGMNDLRTILYQSLKSKPNCHLMPKTQLKELEYKERAWNVTCDSAAGHFQVQLLLSTEGVSSRIRDILKMQASQTSYSHYAFITNVTLSKSLNGVAVERFLKSGAIAMLPWQDCLATMVLSKPKHEIEYLNNLPEQDCIRYCQSELGGRYGQITKIGHRVVVPLNMKLARQHYFNQLLFLGNSVHTIHPIAAQGFNLSIRDIKRLHENMSKIGPDRFGYQLSDLEQYVNICQKDQNHIILSTDGLAKSVNKIPNAFKIFGIRALDHAPGIKKYLMQLGMGGIN